jgi:hypothetical protein
MLNWSISYALSGKLALAPEYSSNCQTLRRISVNYGKVWVQETLKFMQETIILSLNRLNQINLRRYKL